MVALDDPAEQKRLIEALLFASPEPVTLRTIQNRLPESADVGGILLELQSEYEGRGVNLVRLEDAWAFRTAADIGPYLAMNKKEEKKLSRAALETLSIIAYHQPVTRAEIENIRGVATNKGTLDVLLEAGWIKPGRRRETPGRPVTWITSTTFLDEFGISELKDLPGLQELKASGLLDNRPAIETIPGAADLFANEDGQIEGAAEEESEAENYENIGEFDQIEDSDDDQDELQKESA
ncbi:MAG TPA: SMC-Scp complex subunit ScpB [Alphaproteobacteria bacterium]|nr:SMC-Scp complex subunit ScpB [Alphaproteobacteria bacterium]HNS45332.1 SMC-Scp complex subunit ScpB [Alphaproteobacteria bacterium]